MRFMTRSLLGIMVLTLTLGLLGLAGSIVFRAMEAKNAEEPRRRGGQEREFAVNVETFSIGSATPVITAYGEVASRRTLEIRAVSGGTITELSGAFRDGGRAMQNDVLVQIDPSDANTKLELAKTEQAEANAELSEAQAGVLLAQDEVNAATQQRELRAQALARQKDLLARGAGTSSSVEVAELAVSSAEQTLVGRRQAIAQAEARINRAKIALDRHRITVAEAERTLAETTITAPFTGLLSDVSAVPGGLVTPNEILGTLIDPDALEISFRVSNAQFQRLIGDNDQLNDIMITATLMLDDIPIPVTGKIDRVGARVGAGQTGRLLYAQLDKLGTRSLRPGDFMTVEISEPELTGVSLIPATAVNTKGEILLIGEGDRLELSIVQILRRQGDMLIVASDLGGREYATERLPQIGAGVKVRPVRAGAVPEAPEMVQIDDATRAQMVASISANTRMPAPVRQRLLDRLSKDEVPAEMVARFADETSKVAENDNIALDSERRARLIAFVKNNENMPLEAKDRILAQLEADQVPRQVVERLESRIGG